MGRTVLLKHDLPDGSWHIDWLVERAAGRPPARRVLTLRTTGRPDDPNCHTLRAERIPDHRAAYLTYEGEVSGGRGTVRRVAEGEGRILKEDPDCYQIAAQFAGCPPRLWEGRPAADQVWVFFATGLAGGR